MKKGVLITLVFLSILSCSINDDDPTFYFEFIPIENVVIPETFEYGNVYSIEYSYFKQSSCHHFNDLFYEPLNNTRTVAVINRVYHESTNVSCEELTDQIETRSFQFHAIASYDSVVFKFWQGVDEEGEDEYLIIEVPVE